MADNQEVVQDDEEMTPGYKPPAEKSLSDIVGADQDDESLRKYKESLLGSAISNVVVVEEANPNRVIVKSLSLVVEGRPDVTIDLSKGKHLLAIGQCFIVFCWQIWIPSRRTSSRLRMAFTIASESTFSSNERLSPD